MLWLLISAAFGCDLEGSRGQPPSEQMPTDVDSLWLIAEIWAHPSTVPRTLALLDALEAHGHGGTVVVEAGTDTAPLVPLLETIADSENKHVLALRLPSDLLPTDPAAGRIAMRALRKPYKGWGLPKVVLSPLPTRMTEAILGRSGFTTLLLQQGTPSGIPRPAVVFEGQPRIGIVLPAGHYGSDCGSEAMIMPWTGATADRATAAVQRSTRESGPRVLRIGIDTAEATALDIDTFVTWLADAENAGLTAQPAASVRPLALRMLRTASPDTYDPSAPSGGRIVSHTIARDAAEALRAVQTIPRTIAGTLSPTEAFLVFTAILAEQGTDRMVQIGAIAGPQTLAASELSGVTEIERADLVSVSKALVAAPPDEIPAALPVGPELLTAGELLLALASAVRGDTPIRTQPVAVPDPNDPGLGWGASSVP